MCVRIVIVGQGGKNKNERKNDTCKREKNCAAKTERRPKTETANGSFARPGSNGRTNSNARLLYIRATAPIRSSRRRKFGLAGSKTTAPLRDRPALIRASLSCRLDRGNGFLDFFQ